MQSDSGKSVYVNAKEFRKGVHASLTCDNCHESVKDYPHPKPMPKVDCSICHSDIVQEFSTSVHAGVGKSGDKDIPTCQTCHGLAHAIVSRSDQASPVARKNLPDTCGSCHANPDFLSRHNVPFARPVEAYRLSVHGRSVEQGNQAAPSCSDCHGSHTIVPARDPHSKINHWNVAATCGACHADIQKTYLQSVHGQAMTAGVRDSPVCTDCHGEHLILAPSEPQSLVNPARVSTVTCGRCHSNERLEARYNLPADRVPTFESSYHGLALREGSQTVANCASCHGVHNIFPTQDQRSTVNPRNLAATCGKCHAGAGTRFAIGPVHVSPASVTEHPAVRWIRLFYLGVIPLTLGFMLLHNALDFFAKLVRGSPRHQSHDAVVRMELRFRVAHWLVMLSFPVLVITGFALKYPDAWWVGPILRWDGLFAMRGTIHRIAALLLMSSIFNFVQVVFTRRDRLVLRALLPRVRDLSDLRNVLLYNLGIRREKPTFGMFNYAEKVEYWAFLWGMAVMTISGLMLWFINFTLRHFPKWIADAATSVHFYEAVLATLAILVWHFYFVIFDPDVYPMDRTWLTGKASADHLRETRPEYYLALVVDDAETAAQPEPPRSQSQAAESISQSASTKGGSDKPSDVSADNQKEV